MVRKNIYDILHSVKFELEIEYERLFSSFYDTDDVYLDYSINQLAKDNFGKFSQIFIGRCTSIDDFNKTYEFNFKRYPTELDLNYFLLFCEYAYNICIELQEVCHQRDKIKVNRLANNILECIDILGYKEIEKERISIFVEASPEALAVAEMSQDELEGWYDELYQLCLIAILELDNVERKRKVNELKKKIEK